MQKAHYDKRNEADYLAISRRIEEALQILGKRLEIPATEKELAKLAKCSRGTLRNRTDTISRLKVIKKERLHKNAVTNGGKTIVNKLDSSLDKNNDLDKKIELSREELSIWVNKYRILEVENKKLVRANLLIQTENAELIKLNNALVKENSDLHDSLSIEESPTVISFADYSKK